MEDAPALSKHLPLCQLPFQALQTHKSYSALCGAWEHIRAPAAELTMLSVTSASHPGARPTSSQPCFSIFLLQKRVWDKFLFVFP